MLYKLTEGYPKPFKGRYIQMNGKIYANPTEEQLREAGYMPLKESEMPDVREGFYYTDTYVVENGEIVQLWEEHEIEAENNEEDNA